MRILGLEVSVRKATNAIVPSTSVYDRGWGPVVRGPFAGAWQRNMPLVMENPLAHATLYRCVTMIANDIAKMRLKLLEQVNTTWQETTIAAFSPVMNKPNRYQTRIQFYEKWLISKLRTGNTYVLKERDQRNVVIAMYILSPHKVKPLKASDGSVFYELDTNELAGIPDNRIVVPRDEIFHSGVNFFFEGDL